jgi:hypothetical protein
MGDGSDKGIEGNKGRAAGEIWNHRQLMRTKFILVNMQYFLG